MPFIERVDTVFAADGSVSSFGVGDIKCTWNNKQYEGQEYVDSLSNDIIALNTKRKINEIIMKIIHELDKSEKHVSNDPPYPNDVALWISYRATLRNDMQAVKVMTSSEIDAYSIPQRPF